jgi:tRNA (guanine-N7-)-methyltransferase
MTTPPVIYFDPEQLPQPLDLQVLFPGIHHLELEVGCGKGKFLLNRAAAHPAHGFIGLEYAKAYIRTMEKRAIKLGLENIRLARSEAAQFVKESLPDSSLHAFHLLYPDPWPKRRHHKRRLIQHDFLQDLRRVLARDAEINIATDHEDYFTWIVKHFHAWQATFVIHSRALRTMDELRPFEGRTHYELKFLKEGRSIYLIQGYRTGF